MRRLTVLICVVLLAVIATMASAGGFVVILKNGHKIPCREPLEIEGDNAILTLVTGTVASYPVSEVDLVETQRYNKQGYGDALLLEELSMEGTPIPTPTPRQSLGSYATIDAGSRDPELGSTWVPTPTPTPGIKLQTDVYHDERVDQAFRKIFDDRNLLIYRTSAGTQPSYFYVQTVTDNQREVFEALQIVSEAYALIHKLQPDIAPTAVELQMIQTSGKAAGTFRLLPEMAQELAEKQTPIEQFYVNYVIF
jgi:hypothetical protein